LNPFRLLTWLVIARDWSNLNPGDSVLGIYEFLKCPSRHIQVVHISTAPASVRILVGRVVARTSVSDLYDNGSFRVSTHFGPVKMLTIIVREHGGMATNLQATPAAPTIIRIAVGHSRYVPSRSVVWIQIAVPTRPFVNVPVVIRSTVICGTSITPSVTPTGRGRGRRR